ncbi:MAG TPA: ABC transporter permease [Anaerolineales bacterium]|nr:ABC transporter permease [Anaerolineales bacterium]
MDDGWLLAISIIDAAVRAGTPVLFAALGELLAEKAGVLNLGVEGMMIMGAVTGFMVGQSSSNPWVGLLGGVVAGAIMALLFAVVTITLRGDPVVSGLALMILGVAFSSYIGNPYVQQPAQAVFSPIFFPVLSELPFLGPAFFSHDWLVYISIGVVPGIWYLFNRTRVGLDICAVGENPSAADSAGINVNRIRYLCTIAGGAMAGAGGAYLSMAYSPLWTNLMTANRGWIAIGVVIFSGWNPILIMAGAYLFGGVDALSLRIQAAGIHISSFLLNMLPYILTVLVLVATVRGRRRRYGPAGLGRAFDREEG